MLVSLRGKFSKAGTKITIFKKTIFGISFVLNDMLQGSYIKKNNLAEIY